MKPQELKRAMAAALEYSNSFEEVISAEVHDAVIALLRRDWDVRVLDAWAGDDGSYSIGVDGNGCKVFTLAGRHNVLGEGTTPDAARHAAALAVWTELKKRLTPEQIEDIGEYP